MGETKPQMHAVLDWMDAALPAHKPRYLMGVGTVKDFFQAVARGVDIFDCVLPTRLARHGAALTISNLKFKIPNGGRADRINMRNAQYADDPQPIEPGCACYACTQFSRAYIRHLLRAREIVGLYLLSIHNLHVLLELMRRIRASILDGTFEALKAKYSF